MSLKALKTLGFSTFARIVPKFSPMLCCALLLRAPGHIRNRVRADRKLDRLANIVRGRGAFYPIASGASILEIANLCSARRLRQ